MDTPYWWEELTAIPDMGDIKKLAWKIHASFDVSVAQCKALRSQEHTAPPAPKCLKRGMFLPDNPSYQDVWMKASPLAPREPHPLAMSVRELRWSIGKYTTFNEHVVFKGLGNALPEAEDKDTGTPPADSTTSSAMTDVENTQLSPTETQLADDPIPPSPGYKYEAEEEDTVTPLADSTTSPAMTDAKDTKPSPVET